MEKVIAAREDVVKGVAQKVLMATFLAAFTAGMAQIAIKLPFTPVPITLQTLAVIISGMVLGSRWGTLSQLEYVALGLSGVPVFAGGGAGLGHLLGPTGGYLIGFIGAAFASGLIVELWRGKGSFVKFFLAGIAGIIVIYLMGALWLSVWLSLLQQTAGTKAILTAWDLGIKPFILPDMLKVVIAAGITPYSRQMVLRILKG